MTEPVHRVTAEGDLSITVHVQPGARRSQVAGRHGDALKVAVAAPAQDGRANAELCVVVAEVLGVRPASVRVASGHRSRRKRLLVQGGASAVDRLRRVLDEGSTGA
jgi:hypothetical protein